MRQFSDVIRIDGVARESYGRLVAYLSAQTHDLAGAEDALSEALISALNHWPRDGVPQNPEAWLMTAARRSLIDVIRHERVVEASEPTVKLLHEDSMETSIGAEFPDERLKLLFVCAHPAIDPAMHTPLMLQTVLGLDAARIAHAFLIAPKTMGQRLSRRLRRKPRKKGALLADQTPLPGYARFAAPILAARVLRFQRLESGEVR
jgi:predicted RNA polymerase sigma factor